MRGGKRARSAMRHSGNGPGRQCESNPPQGAAEKGAGLYSGYQAGKEVKAEPTKTAHVTGGYESLAATSGKRESFTFNSGGDNTYLG